MVIQCYNAVAVNGHDASNSLDRQQPYSAVAVKGHYAVNSLNRFQDYGAVIVNDYDAAAAVAAVVRAAENREIVKRSSVVPQCLHLGHGIREGEVFAALYPNDHG
ncbi:hypothetical protein PoB_004762400 [Plakobranchus ocellatus]|uniref:Uncharacterized protein n=1 Tax=Plakobranchus ocellatus TaxID=259542 RepID=A0AAV4BRZ0_9GAST|nr:hypothetical protein PoB_004762400 [Plakobranchus ocellatus]